MYSELNTWITQAIQSSLCGHSLSEGTCATSARWRDNSRLHNEEIDCSSAARVPRHYLTIYLIRGLIKKFQDFVRMENTLLTKIIYNWRTCCCVFSSGTKIVHGNTAFAKTLVTFENFRSTHFWRLGELYHKSLHQICPTQNFDAYSLFLIQIRHCQKRNELVYLFTLKERESRQNSCFSLSHTSVNWLLNLNKKI